MPQERYETLADSVERSLRECICSWHQWLSTQVGDHDTWQSVPWWCKKTVDRLDGYWEDIDRYRRSGNSTWLDSLATVVDRIRMTIPDGDSMPSMDVIYDKLGEVLNE